MQPGSDMLQILLGVGVFTGIVLLLVAAILAARSKLVASGKVTIVINDEREIQSSAGTKLMGALGESGLFVSSACGAAERTVWRTDCRMACTEGGNASIYPSIVSGPGPGRLIGTLADL